MAKENSQSIKVTAKVTDLSDTENKISGAEWGLLFTGAGFLDLIQPVLDAMVVGFVANLLIDIVVGLSLAWFFHTKGVLDRKLAISLMLAFGADFITLGIMPTWIADIGYAWIVTEGVSKTKNASQIVKTIKR
jgi:hypothetical protein